MSLAHATIKDIDIDPRKDTELVDVLRGLEQHRCVRYLIAAVKVQPEQVLDIISAAALQGFLLGQAFEQANSLERLINPQTKRHLP